MTVDTQTDFEVFLAGLSIDVRQEGACTTIALGGEWDLAQQENTRDAIQRALASRPERMVLDLSRLTFMDSTGIHGILELANLAAPLNIDLMVIRGPRAVHRIFELCQLSERLTFIEAA
jgi:anti-sigma B factor antagonist